jgi:hypothetical protein
MTMRNLNRDRNLEMARLLIGAGKTIFVASIQDAAPQGSRRKRR